MLVFRQPGRCLVVTPAVVADLSKGSIRSEFRDHRQGHCLVQTAWPNFKHLWAIFHFLFKIVASKTFVDSNKDKEHEFLVSLHQIYSR